MLSPSIHQSHLKGQKICTQCSRSLPCVEFYKNPKLADGLTKHCKSCTISNVKANRLRNIDKYRAYDKARGQSGSRLAISKQCAKKWKTANPDRAEAQTAVANAIAAGNLVRPSSCSRCAASGVRVQAHHRDYTKKLEVEWLCRLCHVKADRERRAA